MTNNSWKNLLYRNPKNLTTKKTENKGEAVNQILIKQFGTTNEKKRQNWSSFFQSMTKKAQSGREKLHQVAPYLKVTLPLRVVRVKINPLLNQKEIIYWPNSIFLHSAYPLGLESLRRYPLRLGWLWNELCRL